jgi:hypothetical protein
MVEIMPQQRVILPGVVPDVGEYRSMITGETISGRAQHRDHLKRHGCEEVGNEKPVVQAPTADREQIKHDIRRAKDQIEAGMAPTLERLREESPRMVKEMGLD